MQLAGNNLLTPSFVSFLPCTLDYGTEKKVNEGRKATPWHSE